MSALTAVAGMPAKLRATPVGGAAAGGGTFAAWLASTASAAGPTRYWAMDETSGTTMTADIGGINGTYQNASDLLLNITDAQAEKWVGFGGAVTSPGHATIATALQSAAFTAMVLVQFDRVVTKHVLLTTGGASVAGQFSFEVVDDGAGGLKPRCWSVNATPQAVVYVGTNTGSIPVGSWCALFYVRRSNGTQEVWVASATGVAQIPLTLDSGTAPGSWSAHPAATWYLGAWTSGSGPLNGVARSLALWNTALSSADIAALGSIDPQIQNVVWAAPIDAGVVDASASLQDVDITNYVHPEVSYTAEITTQGSLGTWSLGSAAHLLDYGAGAVDGADTAGRYRISKGGINSPVAVLTIEVGEAAAVADLPFFGQYYGGVVFGGLSAANTQGTSATEQGSHFFFYAEHTGTLDQIFIQWRMADGYSSGTGGTYTLEIRAANATTRAPLTGVSPICRVTGINPGNNPPASFITYNFTLTGQVVAGNPYALVVRNTHATPGSNFVSTNIGAHTAFDDATDPSNYQEPPGSQGPGTNPASVGSSPARASGWVPVVIDGKRWYPWPAKGANGVLSYRRLGPMFAAFRYTTGQWVGWGAWGGGGTYAATVSATNQLRVRFRVSRATRTVSGVFARICRLSASGGSLVVRLESGGTDTGNGTLVEEVTVASSFLYDVGGSEVLNEVGSPGTLDFVHYVWVPFASNRTLTLNSFYQIRLLASGGGNFRMWCSSRSDAQGLGPNGRGLTWDEWDGNGTLGNADRAIEWSAWEDSKDGTQVSTNSGSSWAGHISRMAPIIFKCVT